MRRLLIFVACLPLLLAVGCKQKVYTQKDLIDLSRSGNSEERAFACVQMCRHYHKDLYHQMVEANLNSTDVDVRDAIAREVWRTGDRDLISPTEQLLYMCNPDEKSTVLEGLKKLRTEIRKKSGS